MEFLIGRSLANNILNLLVEPFVQRGDRAGRARPRRSSPRRSPTPGWATAAWAGSPPASSTRWRRSQHPRHRLRPALRVRHLPPGDRRTAGRSSSPTTGSAGPTPGRSSARRRRWTVARRTARSELQGRDGSTLVPDVPTTLRRRALRPAGRRLRRPDGQHAAALGRGGAPTTSTSPSSATATSSAPSTRRSPPRSLTRVLYPDDSTAARQGAAVRAGVLPRRLLAGRHRARASGDAATTGTPSPTRSPSSSTTPTRRWPSPS